MTSHSSVLQRAQHPLQKHHHGSIKGGAGSTQAWIRLTKTIQQTGGPAATRAISLSFFPSPRMLLSAGFLIYIYIKKIKM